MIDHERERRLKAKEAVEAAKSADEVPAVRTENADEKAAEKVENDS